MANQKITLDNVVQKQGTFEQQYAALKGATWLISSEIQGLRQNNPELRNGRFRTGDGAVYQKNNFGNFMLYVTSAGLNPILKAENFSGAVSQIRATGNYKVNPADLGAIVAASKKKAEGATVIDTSKLTAKKYDSEWSYIEFSTSDYADQLNGEDKKLAQAYHGKGKQFGKTMKMLADSEVKTTRAYFLGQGYLAKNADKPIARLSALNNFNNNSNANASNRNIDNNNAFAFGMIPRWHRELKTQARCQEIYGRNFAA
ncbi:MAG: hypothetical protein V1837_02965 [Candidatus Woesearchaeota archaeon]